MKSLLLILSLVGVVSIPKADTLYAASTAGPGGTGQAWNSAFRSINFAFAEWKTGDEIWIARGTYSMPDSGYRVKNGMVLYGGFAGTETMREQRDWYRQPTILRTSGPSTRSLTCTDCDSSTRINGLTFELGGMIVHGGAPRILNCHFRSCDGGDKDGAALSVSGASRIRIEYCVFENNTTKGDGGGVSLTSCTTDVKSFGPFIAQCFFVGNSARRGGGVFVSQCAGIPQIVSSVFTGNTAQDIAGAVFSRLTYLYITNTTFAKSAVSTPTPGVALTIGLNGGAMLNSIIWNGDDSDRPHLQLIKTPEDSTTFTSTSNLIERDFVNAFYQNDPLFENMSDADGADNFLGTDDDGLALSSISAVHDAGYIDKFVNGRPNDVIGNPRLVGRKIDLGAYEPQRTGRVGYRDVMTEMRTGKLVLFFRHGKTDWDSKEPGPEPACFPGRNLIVEGREQTTGVGAQQRMLGVPIGDAFSSPVCRCWESLLHMVGRYEKKDYWASGGSATIAASRLKDLETIPTNGNRAISTHDAVANLVFNPDGGGQIMTTAELQEGDALIVRPLGDTMEVIAQWCSDTWERYHVRFPEGATSVDDEVVPVHACIKVSPTPASEHVRISAENACTVRVVDMIGREQISIALPGNGQPVELNVSSWAPGLYSIVGVNANGRIVVRR
ncbi:MAG: hypothetical protein NTX15_11700 [Candidatus Kapabacteria bacterium]|nr:hypothetical protein [Candidatus Kapabacteria bacterium]